MAAWIWYGPGAPAAQRHVDELAPLGDPRAVPARPVLVLEQHQLAVVADPRVAARVVQEHQRQQPGRLRRVGEERDHDPGQADRLGAQLAPDRGNRPTGRRVALVEDEVEDVQHAVEPLGEQLGGGTR